MPFGIKKRKVDQSLQVRTKAELDHLQVTCPKCNTVYSGSDAYDRLYICPQCGAYMPMGAKERLMMVLDNSTFTPWFEDVQTANPLNTLGYPEKIAAAQAKSGCSEAVTIGQGRIGGYEAVIGVCDPNFMVGSMGQAMGERITRAFESATKRKLPVILFCCSGGARMQEGILSLMQMEKTAAAVKMHADAGLFYCAVLTDPTMGGVTASFAALADVILAEPQARVGFAGPRVIQSSIGITLPQGFQTAEFQLEHGFVDRLVERKDLRSELHFLLRTHGVQSNGRGRLGIAVPRPDPKRPEQMSHPEMSAWEKVKLCRSGNRATAMDYIMRIFSDFRELHGDRCFGDDQALIGGLAYIGKQPVTIIAYHRGKTIQERLRRNFGMPKPEGYRKAVRLMKQAEKFHRPIISFINTSGAFCGIDAEERGQGEAIARSIMEMSALKVPTLSIIIGEGGSGGALAAAVGNEVWMLEHSTYAVVSAEGYSAILWKTEGRAEEAAGIMKITARDLAQLGIIDRIIPEFGGATEETADQIAAVMADAIKNFLKIYSGMSEQQILTHRYKRFRKF